MQSTIIIKAIREAVKLLDATGVKYAVVDLEGNEFIKGLELRPVKPEPSRKKVREYSTFSTYFNPYLANVKVGDVVSVPIGPFVKEKEALRGAITARCSLMWGNNSYKSCITDTAVEVLRTA